MFLNSVTTTLPVTGCNNQGGDTDWGDTVLKEDMTDLILFSYVVSLFVLWLFQFVSLMYNEDDIVGFISSFV